MLRVIFFDLEVGRIEPGVDCKNEFLCGRVHCVIISTVEEIYGEKFAGPSQP